MPAVGSPRAGARARPVDLLDGPQVAPRDAVFDQLVSTPRMPVWPHAFRSRPQAFPRRPHACRYRPRAFRSRPQTFPSRPHVCRYRTRALLNRLRALLGRPRAFLGQPRAFLGQPRAFLGQPHALRCPLRGLPCPSVKTPDSSIRPRRALRRQCEILLPCGRCHSFCQNAGL
jgi:hypothetical protein